MEAKATTTFPEQWPYHEGFRGTPSRTGVGFRLGGGEFVKQPTAAAEPKTVTASRNLFFDAIPRVVPIFDVLHALLPDARTALACCERAKDKPSPGELPDWYPAAAQLECSEGERRRFFWESECARAWELWMRAQIAPLATEFGLADEWAVFRLVASFRFWTHYSPGSRELQRWIRIRSDWRPYGEYGDPLRLRGAPPKLPDDPGVFRDPRWSEPFYYARWPATEWTWNLYRKEIEARFRRHLDACKQGGEKTHGALAVMRRQLEADRVAIEAWHVWRGELRAPVKLAGKLSEADTDLPPDRHFLWLARRQCKGERPDEIAASDGVGRTAVEKATAMLAEQIGLAQLRRWRPGPR